MGLLFCNNSFAMSEIYKKKFYNGCYPDSKKYLGADRAREYCICTIEMLSKKYTDKNMDNISKQNEEYQLKAFSFASIHCSNNANAL